MFDLVQNLVGLQQMIWHMLTCIAGGPRTQPLAQRSLSCAGWNAVRIALLCHILGQLGRLFRCFTSFTNNKTV